MPRPLRIEYPGAIYHVMNRGDRREPIFIDDTDYDRFLDTLGEACAKTDWQVHAYCLMLNHFHLVLETPGANLVAGMTWLLSTYTSRFNRRHRLVGHLFSGRYKALIVDGSGSGYFKKVCDYVHLNPVRAQLVRPDQKLREFRWSSWPEYLKASARRVPWLRVDRLLGEYHVPKDSAAGRAYLEKRLEERRAHEDGSAVRAIRRGWCFGESAFRQELLEQVHRHAGANHLSEPRRETARDKARQILDQELNKLGWTGADLQRLAKGNPQKIRIARRLRKETTMTLKWIADHLHMGAAGHVANRFYRAGRVQDDSQIQIAPV